MSKRINLNSGKLIPQKIQLGYKQNKMSRLQKVLLFFVLLFFLYACRAGKNAQNTVYHLSQLRLKKNLSVPIDSLHTIVSQQLRGMVVDKKGNIYLKDVAKYKIDILNSRAQYLGSMGRKGHGPGEFDFIMGNMSILGDTLFILQYPSRLSMFSIPSGHLIQTDNISRAKINGHPIGFPEKLTPLTNGNYEIISTLNTSFKSPLILSIYNHNLKPKDILVHSYPPTNTFIYRNPGNNHAFGFSSSILFAPHTEIAFGSHGFIYEAHSDSTHIYVYNSTGNKIRDISFKYNPIVLTQSDMDSLANLLPNNKWKNMFRKAIKRNNIKIPGNWMIMRKLLVDNKKRCWIELVTPGKSTHTWWIFNKNGHPQWKFKLNRYVHLYTIRNGEVYGIWKKRGHYSRIMRYKIEGMN
ncbi:MAG TPA: hypothetical protein VKA34_03785 [Balneolales bacterium]|nr:hypothetical protein [Balneolales bacterium]